MVYLGIDVSKAKLDCLLLAMASNKRKSKTVSNSPDGYATLLAWLAKQQAGAAHVVMEPTGGYHEPAALALTEAGLKVALVNPAQLRQFAHGLGIKTKTDAADSAILARYGATQHPAPWHPPPACVRELRALLARRDAIAEDLRREQNRAEKAATTATPALVQRRRWSPSAALLMSRHCTSACLTAANRKWPASALPCANSRICASGSSNPANLTMQTG